MANILAFAGSTRTGSYNQLLLNAAIKLIKASGHSVTEISLRDYDIPLYSGDLEASSGLPESVIKLKDLSKSHSGLLIASPEYNGFFPPLIKNLIDWLSRPAAGEAPLASLKGKVACLLSASPGTLGGVRSLGSLRLLLENLLVLVNPEQMGLSGAHEAFAADGALKNPKQAEMLQNTLTSYVTLLSKICD